MSCQPRFGMVGNDVGAIPHDDTERRTSPLFSTPPSMTGQVSGQPLRILHVVSYYPPYRVGGVGEVVRLVHEELLSRGTDSAVLTSGNPSRAGSRIETVGRTPTRFMVAVWRKRRTALQYDIVHCHHGEPLLLILLLRLTKRRPTLIMTLHVDVRQLPKSRGKSILARVLRSGIARMRSLFDLIAARLVDRVTVVSEALAEELGFLVPHGSIAVVRNGVKLEPLDSVPSRRTEILFVGTPGMRKRTHLLGEVLSRVTTQVPGATLRIVGFGKEDDPDLAKSIDALKLADRVEFEGLLPHIEVAKHYRRACVLLVPSSYEGLTMVLLEAMANGLPAVATRVSGHPEVIEDSVNGFLVDVDDTQTMAERCAGLLSDSQILDSMSRAARLTIQHSFTTQAQVDKYLAVYEHAHSGPN